MLIKKLYLDIECSHKSKQVRKGEKWKFSDWKGFELCKGGVIGILGMVIDTDKSEWKELLFRQYVQCPRLGMNIGEKEKTELLSLMLDRADMIITFNGRGFDIPIIIENFVHESVKCDAMKMIIGNNGKDRDLMDICIHKKGMWLIGGGLEGVVKKLCINYDMNRMSREDGRVIDLNSFIIQDSCNKVFIDETGDELELKLELEKILVKNENDIRVLPLVEYSLELLLSKRKNIDNYHKTWDSFYQCLEKEKRGEI